MEVFLPTVMNVSGLTWATLPRQRLGEVHCCWPLVKVLGPMQLPHQDNRWYHPIKG